MGPLDHGVLHAHVPSVVQYCPVNANRKYFLQNQVGLRLVAEVVGGVELGVLGLYSVQIACKHRLPARNGKEVAPGQLTARAAKATPDASWLGLHQGYCLALGNALRIQVREAWNYSRNAIVL
jgi:hypothetical protein